MRTVACPACGGTVEVRAAGWSVNLACRYCGSILDVSRTEVQLIERHSQVAGGFALPIGAHGQLFDAEWEVIGALERGDGSARWFEYLLFNPYLGYRWLVEFEGEWQFGTMLIDRPEGDSDSVTWRGARFTRSEDEGTAYTRTVLGEFYWRVTVGETVATTMFERGDVTLSCEGGGDEVNWTQLVTVQSREVMRAFAPAAPEEPTPERVRRGLFTLPHGGGARAESDEPRDDLGDLFLAAIGTAVVAILLMVLLAGSSKRVDSRIEAPFSTTLEGRKVGTLTIARPWQFVTVRARGDAFSNRWIDLDYSLVNRATGQSIDSYGLVERYSGRDSDGNWSEGSGSDATLIGQVPAGTYDLYVDARAHSWPNDIAPADSPWGAPETIGVHIEAETGSLPWGNWLTLVLLAFFPPCFIAWERWKHHFS